MATPQSNLQLTPELYLARERKAEERSEFRHGRMYAMAGESLSHSTVCFNIAGRVFTQLLGKSCRGFSPNMKICVSETGRYYYPDLSVACGEPMFHDDFKDVLLNEQPEFAGLNPSIEHFSRIFWQQFVAHLRAPNLHAVTIKLWENEIAWASFHGALPA